jgi:hypothetical protein
MVPLLLLWVGGALAGLIARADPVEPGMHAAPGTPIAAIRKAVGSSSIPRPRAPSPCINPPALPAAAAESIFNADGSLSCRVAQVLTPSTPQQVASMIRALPAGASVRTGRR